MLAFGAAAGLVLAFALTPAAATPLRHWLGAALLLGLATGVLGRPHEYTLGGLDPGVYVNTAASIVHHRSIAYYDPEVAALDEATRAALFREPHDGWTQGSRLVGFYLTDANTGRVVPHGMHLFPSAMAVGYGLAGLDGALAIPPLLTIVAIASLSLLVRRVAGPIAAPLVALLLILNPAESWFGRYPAAETMLQAALYPALLLLALAPRAPAKARLPVGAAAGALLGMVHLAKVDTFVIPLAVAVLFGWLALRRQLTAVHFAFLLSYAVLVLHAFAHVAITAGHYAYSVYARSLPGPTAIATAALVAATLTTVAFIARRSPTRLILPATVGLLLLALYAYYLRPLDLFGEIAAAPEAVQPVIRNRLHAFPRLGWYIPPLALLLAGAALANRKHLQPATVLLVLIAVLEALVVLYDPRITPEYPWAARRWDGIIIPVVLALAAIQVGQLRAHTVLAAGLAIALLSTSAGASAPLIGHREYAGSGALIQRIADEAQPGAVILLDDDLVGWRLSAPLAHLQRETVFILFGAAKDDPALATTIDSWDRAGRPVYWLRYRENQTPFRQWDRYWRPNATWKTDLPEVIPTIESPPRELRRFDVPVTLYQALKGDT